MDECKNQLSPVDESILLLIPHGRANAILRGQLSAWTGMGDRAVRRSIERLRKGGYLILNHQDVRGYYIATEDDMDEIFAQYKQDTAWALTIMSRRKEMRKLLKAAGYPV